MSYKYGPSIVTDGLVFYVDAANSKSYDGSAGGTTWTDLVGDNNGTLTNMETNPVNAGYTYDSANGGSLVFDGADDKVLTSFNEQLGDFTACAWFKKDSIVNTFERIFDKNYISGFWVGRNSSNQNSWGGGVRESSSPFGRYITLSDGDWHYIVSRRSGSTHTILGDGITNTVSGTVATSPLSSNSLRLACSDQANGDEFGGSIAIAKLYNRALSDAEILQNYNALKNRFA